MSNRLVWTGIALGVALVLASGCGQPGDEGPTRSYEGGGPVCEAGPDSPDATVWADFHTLGSASNAVVSGDGYLWVVESRDNTVSRLDPHTGAFDAFFIDVAADGTDRNPYEIYVDEQYHLAYISNQYADTVSVASTQTGEIVAELGVDADAFDAPQGIAASDDYVYVTNTHLVGRGYEEGSVTVIDRRSHEVLGRVATRQKNPQFVDVIPTPDGPRVAVVSSGEIHSSGTVRSNGALELWAETDEPTSPDKQIFELQVRDERIGAPGRPLVTPDHTRLYLPSATAPVLFAFDLQRLEWLHDTSDPLSLYESGAKATHNATIDERGIIYLTAYNEDALYLFDTSCDRVLAGPIGLGTTDLTLEGPVDVHVVDDEAFVVMTMSNSLAKVELGY